MPSAARIWMAIWLGASLFLACRPGRVGRDRHSLPGREASKSPAAASIEIGPLGEPAAVAAGGDGSIYICEALAERISVFDRRGALLRRWGRPGAGEGELRSPRGIAVAPDGRVYVSDTGNQRIEVFGADGRFEEAWGEFGSAPGQFAGPLGLAADLRRVYVADSRNNRVQVFDREGRFLFYVWNYGQRGGQFDRPVDVAAGADGSFYVSDQGNSRVQKFDAEGQFLAAWGGWGPHPGLFAEPGGIDLREGRLYVADTHNHRVQVLDLQGAPVGEWGGRALAPLEGRGLLPAPTDVAALPSGDGVVSCDALADRCRLLTGPSGDPAGAISPMTSSARAAGLSGDTMIVSAASGPLLALDLSGSAPEPIVIFGGHGREAIQFVRPAGVAFDPALGTILVSDAGNFRLATLQLTRADGVRPGHGLPRARFVRSVYLADEEALMLWPKRWPLTPPLIEPGRLACDSRGRVFLIDEAFSRIVVLDAALQIVGSWGSRGNAEGAFLDPSDLAFDPSEKILYVVDRGRRRVEAFDPEGRFLYGWGAVGRADSEFSDPVAIATGNDGSVYVADRGANRVERFTGRGRFMTAWGAPGTRPGGLFKPERLFVDRHDRVLAIDAGGRRLQAFSTEGRSLWDLDLDSAAEAARARRPSSLGTRLLHPQDLAEMAPGAGELPASRAGLTPRNQPGSDSGPGSDAASAAPSAPGASARGSGDSSPASIGPGSGCGAGPEFGSGSGPDPTAPAPHQLRSNAGGYLVCYRMRPEPVPLNEPFAMDVWVYDTSSSSRPNRLAEMVALNVEAVMPEHGHGMIELPQIKPIGEPIPRDRLPDHALAHGAVGNGRFEVQGMRFHMPGLWEVDLDVGRGAITERAQFEIDVD